MQENNQEKCILIYEDDEEILFLCKTILQKNSYRVETMSRCEHVIADIGRIQPHLILMDLWIPEIGGEQAIAIIKENAATKHLPVLVFSANAELKEICKKIGADGYIQKPFDIHLFKQIIEAHVLPD